MELFIKRTIYRHWKTNNEIFDLELIYKQDTNQLVLTSTVIPDWILDNVFFNWEILMDNPPKFDQEKVNSVLADVAKEIFKHPYADQHYFPKSWLNGRGQVTQQFSGKYTEAKFNIKQYELRTVTKKSVFICFYLQTVMHKAISKVMPAHLISYEIINRKQWEKNLQFDDDIEQYVEMYNETKSFVQVISQGTDPSFSAALNKKGEIVYAFVTHSKIINE